MLVLPASGETYLPAPHLPVDTAHGPELVARADIDLAVGLSYKDLLDELIASVVPPAPTVVALREEASA